MTQLRCAVIGAGAAGFGVLRGLATHAGAVSVTLFDEAPDRADDMPAVAAADAGRPYRQDYLRHLKARLGASLPPAKSHFGRQLAGQPVEGWQPMFKSDPQGRLSDYWGASALPLPDRELADWPVEADALRPDYRDIAEAVAIAGEDDAVAALWGGGAATRPRIDRPRQFDRLTECLNRSGRSGAYRFVAGASRQAVETGPEAPNRCVSCGQCMSGCQLGAIFSPAAGIDRLAGLVSATVAGRVVRIDPSDRCLMVDSDGEQTRHGPFDLIFVAAGCLGSSRLLAQSGLAPDRMELQDNTVYSMVLARPGWPRLRNVKRSHTAMTNMIVAGLHDSGAGRDVFVQVYSFFDFIWLLKAPAPLHGLLRWLGAVLREHLAIVRIYMPAELSQAYWLDVDADGRLSVSLARPPAAVGAARAVARQLRRAFARAGAFLLPMPLIRHHTSSHYAATLPMGQGTVDETGAVADGVYLCDSAAFPRSPAYSPTMTIMAFARWVARHAVARRMGPATTGE